MNVKLIYNWQEILKRSGSIAIQSPLTPKPHAPQENNNNKNPTQDTG